MFAVMPRRYVQKWPKSHDRSLACASTEILPCFHVDQEREREAIDMHFIASYCKDAIAMQPCFLHVLTHQHCAQVWTLGVSISNALARCGLQQSRRRCKVHHKVRSLTGLRMCSKVSMFATDCTTTVSPFWSARAAEATGTP